MSRSYRKPYMVDRPRNIRPIKRSASKRVRIETKLLAKNHEIDDDLLDELEDDQALDIKHKKLFESWDIHDFKIDFSGDEGFEEKLSRK